LYAARANVESAHRAAGLWRDELRRNPAAFDAAWKLARADYWLGRHAPLAERRALLEQGIEAGRKAAALRPGRPEGHFWAAANMGELSESFGRLAGLRYREAIKKELDTVLRLDPAYLEGSGDRALGRWYFKVPSWLGGSKALAERHLRASLTYNEHSTASHLFLAELLIEEGRNREARAELQAVIAAPLDPAWVPEDREFKAVARSLLVRIKPAP
jgi:hypothetical protein